jgi:uncharacterized protein (TIGR02118 family)
METISEGCYRVEKGEPMIKIVSTWKRNPNLTEEQCDEHYRKVHTGLARKALEKVPGFRKYVQNKVVRLVVYDYNQIDKPIEKEPDFDRSVEIYFDHEEGLEEGFNTPEMKACYDDHKNFMDINRPASLKVYEVIEEIPLGKK